MSRTFRALKPVYIRTFEGQERPRYYRHNAEFEHDLEFKRGKDGKEIIPPSLREINAKGSGAPEASGPPAAAALSESSRQITIQRAVSRLDHSVDDHWTGDGRPAVHAVNTAAKDPKPTITRSEIVAHCPTILRG
jgi:hypothetical protein